MPGLGAWIRETPPLQCLAGLPHRQALTELRDNRSADAQMRESEQWADAHRWAERWARDGAAYTRALDRGFASQYDVQAEAWTLKEAEAWAFETRKASVAHATGLGIEIWELPDARPVIGADLEATPTATLLIEGWVRELERYILPAAPTAAARAILIAGGMRLLGWVVENWSRLPQGLGGADTTLRGLRRAWPAIAPSGVSRVQTDAVRRLYIGTCGNGHQTGKTPGVAQWVARGHTIAQARRSIRVAQSWAVAVDCADPTVARRPREALRRRQRVVARRTERRVVLGLQQQLPLGGGSPSHWLDSPQRSPSSAIAPSDL